jgi:MYXO-CTERM domain-containing protein
VTRDVPEIDLRAGASQTKVPDSAQGSAMPATTAKNKSGCGCQATDRNGLLGGALLVGASLLIRRRRRP